MNPLSAVFRWFSNRPSGSTANQNKKVASPVMSDNENVPGILMYESRICGYCMAAKRLLKKKGWDYQSIVVDGNSDARHEMMERTGRHTVPQIFFGETHVGGYDDMAALEADGKLDELYESLER